MRQLRGGFLCLGTALTLVAGMVFLLLAWLKPDPDSPLSPERLLREQRRGQQLRDELAILDAIIAAKQALAHEVADGRLRLEEAARRFRELDAGAPRFNPEVLRRVYPGQSDEERYGWEVIGFATGELTDEPSRAATLRRRLEADLDACLGRPRAAPASTARNGQLKPITE
jgi:hypothetical protein